MSLVFNFISISGFHIYSKRSLLWRNCHSAFVFRIRERYSAVIVICFSTRYFQMSLLKSRNILFVVPPISRNYEKAVVLSVWIWIALVIFSFTKAKISIFTASSSKIFIYNFLSSADHFSPVYNFSPILLRLLVRQLSVLLSEACPKSYTSH